MSLGLGIASFIVAFVVTHLLAGRFARFALDEPNARSMHVRPVPRTGGLAVLAGAAMAVVSAGAQYWILMLLVLGLAALSLVDDLRGISTLARLIAHAVAAALLVWYVLAPMHALEMLLLVIAITWITNLYNFMDGSDGLAGGMAVIGFGAYAVAGHFSEDSALSALCVAVAAAAAGFLIHNFHPAKIFLGDVGSIPLGFLAGGLGVAGWAGDVWPLWFPVLVFGPFIGDATITLLRRVFRRERVWHAHRDHYYQRLVRMGFGHRGTALLAYAVMLACATIAVSFRDATPMRQAAAFGLSVVALSAMALWVDLRWTRFARQNPNAA